MASESMYRQRCASGMMSYMGIIYLCGIVVNSGIILVDFINKERKTPPM